MIAVVSWIGQVEVEERDIAEQHERGAARGLGASR